jgi:hypothetical protein
MKILWHWRRALPWRITWRLIGWIPPAISAGLIVYLLYARATGETLLSEARVIETLAPFIAGLHAAFVFSPEDEGALEVTLSSPRPIGWTILERAGLVVALHGGAATLASLVAAPLTGESLLVTLARWSAPLLLFVGLGICLTLITRQVLFSVGLIILVWFGMLIGSEAMLGRWPFLWPIAIYLQPDHIYFALNRVGLAGLGGGLIAWAATQLVRDEERLLLGKSTPHRAPF